MITTESTPENLTIREFSAQSRLYTFFLYNHKLKLSTDQIREAIIAVDQYNKDLVNGMSKEEIENY